MSNHSFWRSFTYRCKPYYNCYVLYAKEIIFHCLKGGKTPNLYELIDLRMYHHVDKFISEKYYPVDNFDSFWS